MFLCLSTVYWVSQRRHSYVVSMFESIQCTGCIKLNSSSILLLSTMSNESKGKPSTRIQKLTDGIPAKWKCNQLTFILSTVMHEWVLFGKPARISFVRKHNSSYCSHGIPLLTAEKAITFRLIAYCAKLSESLHYTEDRRIGSEGSSLSHSWDTLNFHISWH